MDYQASVTSYNVLWDIPGNVLPFIVSTMVGLQEINKDGLVSATVILVCPRKTATH